VTLHRASIDAGFGQSLLPALVNVALVLPDKPTSWGTR